VFAVYLYFQNFGYEYFSMNTVGVKIWQLSLKSALIVYFSSTGNTQKVAYAIKDGLETGGLNVELKNPKKPMNLIFTIMNWPVRVRLQLSNNPGKPIADFLKAKLDLYQKPKQDQALCPQSWGKKRDSFLHLFRSTHRHRRSYTCGENH